MIGYRFSESFSWTRLRLFYFLYIAVHFCVVLTPVDDINIIFSEESLLALNICLGFIMFGIALGIKPNDFKTISLNPKGVITGVFTQFLLLPFLTFVLVYLTKPHPALGLGMILVAACPGGNVSNYISSISKANVALSISLTAVATLASPIMTPLNFEFWGSALPATREYLRAFEIGFPEMLRTVALLLLLPLILGIWFAKQYPLIVVKIKKPIGVLSFLILLGFIAIAMARNFGVFRSQLSLVFLLVFAHNGIALLSGYFTGALVKLPESDRRTLAIETGIQNSGLGLIIIFSFFNGNGGMAIIAAWWGVWHIISGLSVAYFFRRCDARIKIATQT